MRHLLIASLLVACSTEPPPAPTAPTPAASTVAPESDSAASVPLPPPRRLPQKEGQTCAGLAGLRCEDGLHCVMNGTIHPDETGVCMR